MLAFIHVAKTGGQSIETMLESSFGIRHMPAVIWKQHSSTDAANQNFVVPKYGPEDFRRLKQRCPFMQSVGGHSIALWSGVHEVQPTTYFTFLREPIKRGASHYQYHLVNDDPDKTWEDWVQYDVHHNHQVKMFSRNVDAQEAIRDIEKHQVFVGFTEKFDESLVIFRRLFAPNLNISYTRTNTASDNSVAKGVLADEANVQDLHRMYAEEIPLHEWALNEYYPRFVKEYGPTLEQDVEEFRKVRERVNRANILANHVYQRLVAKPFA
jgi:hypothetical protein